MRTNTKNLTITAQRINAINILVDKFSGSLVSKGKGTGSDCSRTLTANSHLSYALSRANATFRVYYGNGSNAYNSFVTCDFLCFIEDQSAKFKKYAILAAA